MKDLVNLPDNDKQTLCERNPPVDSKQMNNKTSDLHTPNSSKSTVLINESPRGIDSHVKEVRDTKETQETLETSDNNLIEVKDPVEARFSNKITTDATKAIENVIAHDGPLIQPKPQEVSQANIATMRNKVCLKDMKSKIV